MTQTIITMLLWYGPDLCPPEDILLSQMLANNLFGILNLGHWNLFDIWNMVLEFSEV